ncbi:MAG: anti-sigma factor antagonist [Actinomycetota bacterium]|nr:anti-sigma factor antagonist [Actinomycetota bacterium]
MGDETNRETVVTPLHIERGGTATNPVVTVRGEIDVATSPRLRTELGALLGRGATEITLDFSGVTFVDSSGLGVLVGALKRLRDGQDSDEAGSLRIVGAQDAVRKVFEITGLETALLADD